VAIADTVASPTPPDQVLEMIVRAAARAIPCPEGALMLVDPGRDALTFNVVIGSTAATVKDLVVPLGHGIAGLVAVSGQALAIANAQEDPRHARDIAERSGYLPTTILAVPVVSRDGTPAGVLELLDRQGQPAFDLDDMELLGMFAEQVAIVLELRRTQDTLAARVGQAMATLGGLPQETAAALGGRVEALAARVEGDEDARRASALAGLVAGIAARGDAEHEACVAVLRAFADYLDTRPALGVGMFG
jgi:GAF domain-containing protein